jgi:hypothetical protein
MSGSKYVTISVVLPRVTRLLEILQIYESKFGNKDIQDLAIQMYNDLEERTKEHFTNPMVICATFLDPRYRKFHFIKDEKERENFINKAKNYIISTYLTKFKSKIIQSDEPKKKKISRENNFSLLCEEDENDDDKIVNGVVSEKAEIELEINNYFLMKIKVNKHSNPLEFYKNNQSLFKRLSKISKMFLL